MSIIHFQVATNALLAVQRTALQQTRVCPPSTISLGPVTIVVDHLEFGANTLRHNAMGGTVFYWEEINGRKSEAYDVPVVQIAQDIQVFVTEMSDVLANPNQPPANLRVFPVTAVVTLDYIPIDDECFLRTMFSHLEYPALPPLPPGVDVNAIKDRITAMVMALFPATAVPFNFANLLSGAKTNVENAGVSVGGHGAFIAFAAQVGTASAVPGLWPAFWRPFYAGGVVDLRGGADWALFIPQDDYELSVSLAIENGLRRQNSKFDLISADTHYVNNGGTATFISDVGGYLHLPDPLTKTFLNVRITTAISVRTPNRLSADITIPSRKEMVDEVLGPVAGMLRILGPLGTFLLGLANSAAAGDGGVPAIPSCTKVDDTHFTCSQPIAVPSLLGGNVNFTRVVALDGGVSLAGTMSAQPLSPPTLSMAVQQFNWRPPRVGCGAAGVEVAAAFQNSAQSLSVLHGEVALYNDGETPVFVCSVQVLNDPAGAFLPQSISVPTAPLYGRISINVPVPPAEYYASPYSCDLLVVTTGGTRLARFNPAPPLTDRDVQRLVAQIVGVLANCEQLVDPWFNFHHGFNPKWSVDPGDARVEHLWQIDVSGVAIGETVTLADARQQEIMRATAGTARRVRLFARVEPAGEAELMLLPRTTEPTGRAGESSTDTTTTRTLSRIGTDQTLLYRAASVSIDGGCERVQAVRGNGRRVVAASGGDALVLIDAADPYRPTTLNTFRLRGVAGAITWYRELLMFGEGGFFTSGGRGRLDRIGGRCAIRQVRAAVAGSNLLYALTSAGLEVLSRDLCQIAAIDLESPVRALLRVGSDLLAGGSAGLWVYSLLDPERPQLKGRFRGPGVVDRPMPVLPIADLAVSPLTGDVVALLEDGSASILAVEQVRPVEVGRVAHGKWLARTALIGGVVATVSDDGLQVNLGVVGETVVS